MLIGIHTIVMLYTRASASDYDDWETKYSNPGWGSKELIPLLEKVCPSCRCSNHTHFVSVE